jgi:GNAT superfamily N-acetyltransferase
MFDTPSYQIIETTERDVPAVTAVYNSHQDFLQSHLGIKSVSEAWVWNEIEVTRELGFASCKIVSAPSGLTVGFLDFKIGEETYLSLLMIHRDHSKSGIGKEILRAFEQYAKQQGSKRIRIDVVTDYDEAVTHFWQSSGFLPEKEITLFWSEKELRAVKMVKAIHD